MTRLDDFTSTVDAARALAEDVPLIGEQVGNVFPGERTAPASPPYVSLVGRRDVRRLPCGVCGVTVPHVGDDVAQHGTCPAGTVRCA